MNLINSIHNTNKYNAGKNNISFILGSGSGKDLFSSNSCYVTGQGNSLLNGQYNFTYSSTQGFNKVYNCFNSTGNSNLGTLNMIFNGPFSFGTTGAQNYVGSASIGGIHGDWAKISLPNPQKWMNYTVSFSSEWPSREAYTFYIIASNNNVNWTQLDYYSQANISNPIPSRTISNPDYYSYYAYVVTQTQPNTDGNGGVSTLLCISVNGFT